MATHAQVAHAFAHKLDKHRTGHNMFVSGNTVYSYGSHFAIARHTTLADGTPAVLFTTKGYSQSTASHISHVRSAVSHLKVLLVKNPSYTPGTADVEDLLKDAERLVEKADRARTRASMHLDDAAHLIEQANALIEAFALPIAKTDLQTLAPNLQEIRDQAAAKRLAQEQARVARQSQARDNWLAGVPGAYFYGTDEHGNAYCRVSADGECLETSQGVSVPLTHARKVLARVRQCREAQQPWKRNSATIRVGDFQVDEIRADGSFKAGCHTFAWAEISRVAATINA